MAATLHHLGLGVGKPPIVELRTTGTRPLNNNETLDAIV
jgi:hypothetical protein